MRTGNRAQHGRCLYWTGTTSGTSHWAGDLTCTRRGGGGREGGMEGEGRRGRGRDGGEGREEGTPDSSGQAASATIWALSTTRGELRLKYVSPSATQTRPCLTASIPAHSAPARRPPPISTRKGTRACSGCHLLHRSSPAASSQMRAAQSPRAPSTSARAAASDIRSTISRGSPQAVLPLTAEH